MAEYTIKTKLVMEGHEAYIAGLDNVAAALERVNEAKEKYDALFGGLGHGVNGPITAHDPVDFEQLEQMLAKEFQGVITHEPVV